MDYHAIHGCDVASFDTPSTHRLPTIAASQALDELQDGRDDRISTGVEGLDEGLLGAEPVLRSASRRGGVKRGQVTEVWGPPGSGRTAIGIQLAANALSDGHDVVWVLRHVKGAETTTEEKEQGTFTQYSCETLAHLLALISRPTTTSIPPKTALVIASGLTALINTALPRSLDDKAASKTATAKGPSPSAKRLQGLQFIINAFQKLAATRDFAVVLLSQCATRMKSEQGPTLVPAVNATVWEQGVSSRVVLFRDWMRDQESGSASVFLAGLEKVDGKTAREAIEHISAFKIEATGISGVHYEANQSHLREAIPPRPKRKRGLSDAEVPDSDDDYGWADEDEDALPPPPSQWQGSEDLILGQDVGKSEDEDQEQEQEQDDDEGDTW